MIRLLPAMAIALASPASAQVAVASVVDSFHEALRAGDRERALALLADDVLVLESGHAEASKSEYAAGHLAADIAYESAVKSTVTERRVFEQGDFGWVASEGRTVGKFRGKDVDRTSAETMVLHKTPDGWRIVHIHWSSAAAH